MTVMADVVSALCATRRLNLTEPMYPDVSTFDRALQIGRTNWRVVLPSDDVRKYARDAAGYHRERETWWKLQANDVKDTIGVSGLEVRAQEVTGGVRHDVVIDPTLGARLSECEKKANEHRVKAEVLERWDSFLSIATTTLTLTGADADFFEIGQERREDA